MNFSSLRGILPLLLLAAASTVGHADPASPEKWSKVEVKGTETYTIVNVDLTTKTTAGTLWIRKADETGNGTPIRQKGDLVTLKPGSYRFYFDTTAKAFGHHLRIVGPNNKPKINLHITNLDPFTEGTEIQVSGDPLHSLPIVVDATGYRNINGGVLFTIGGPGANPSPDDDPDH